jgi:hypothetical protein
MIIYKWQVEGGEDEFPPRYKEPILKWIEDYH